MSDMSLKAKIRNIAREKQILAQLVLQHYLNERFLLKELVRSTVSEYLSRKTVAPDFDLADLLV